MPDLAREHGARQAYVFECMTCQHASPPSETPDRPQRWAADHARRQGQDEAGHHSFTRTVTDLWRVPQASLAGARDDTGGGRRHQLMEVGAQSIRIGDLLAVDGLFFQVVDLRWVPGRAARLALLRHGREPVVLGQHTRYEIKRPTDA
ncbi:hypothetical protein [Streptomyces sp. B6B3]|uniref:DUF7848 domain-containing protein n=1 Tax=Streptomyces sp. B6B3 TaxID=3153570 RepID=UPI00325D0B2B